MPQYYNLSQLNNADNIIEIYAITDTLLKGYFSLFMVLVLGILVVMFRLKKNDTPVNAIMLGSFYSFMLSAVLYASSVFYSGMTKPGLYVFVPAIIMITTAITKWYNKG